MCGGPCANHHMLETMKKKTNKQNEQDEIVSFQYPNLMAN